MISHRWINVLVVIFWLATMAWLVGMKLLPAFHGGEPPTYAAMLPDEEEPALTGWAIDWKDRQVGWAASKVYWSGSESAEVRTIVEFEDLPVSEILREGLGVLAIPLRQAMPPGDDLRLSMTFVNRAFYEQAIEVNSAAEVADAKKSWMLRRISASVALGTMGDIFRIEGEVQGNKLHWKVLATRAGMRELGLPKPELHEDATPLPREALLTDMLTPQTRLGPLHVGQKWTVQTYRAFPPDGNLQLMQGEVVRDELVVWNGTLVNTLVVEYRPEVGGGLTVADEPISTLWVRADGTVVQQKLRVMNMEAVFRLLELTAGNAQEGRLDAIGERRRGRKEH